MMTAETLAKLRTFHVPGFIQALIEQRESQSYQGLSFEERLALLVEAESTRRAAQRIARKIKNSQLMQRATIDQVDFATARGMNKVQFLELAQGDWVHKAHHLVITGPTGSGKTFVASALATNLCRKVGLSVRYMRAHEWLGDLLIARSKGDYSKLRNQLKKLPLIIIDEWLREPLSAMHAREFLDLFDDRYRKASCVVISQLPVADWHSQIQDPTLADAILERLVHDSIRIELKGEESMRKKTSTLPNPIQAQSGILAPLRVSDT